MRLVRRRIGLLYLLGMSVTFNAGIAGITGPQAAGGRTSPPEIQIAERADSLELRLAERKAAKGLTAAKLPDGDQKLYLHPTPLATHRDVIDARAVRGRFDPSFNIELTFSPEASKRLAKATRRHVGRQVAILLNGRVIAAPELTEVISDRAFISGTFTRNEAERLAGELIALSKKPRAR